MVSVGTIALKTIWAMLDACAPGWKRKARTHNYVVTYKEWSFPRLPLGKHGKRQNPAIEVGHVRSMVRLFQIEDCARRYLEQLR